MTGFRADTAIVALLIGLSAATAQAQENASDRPAEAPDAATGEQADTEDGAADRATGGTGLFMPVPPAVDPAPAGGPPRSLLPGPYLPEGSIKRPDLAAPDQEDASGGGNARAGATGDATALSGPVGVDSLDALAPSAVGAWAESDPPALPIDMWRGTDPDILSALIPVLQVDMASPTLKSLARRLLLSPARPPQAPVAVASKDGPGPSARPDAATAGTGDADTPRNVGPDNPETAAESGPLTGSQPETRDRTEGTADGPPTGSGDDIFATSDAPPDGETTAAPDPDSAHGEILRLRLARLYAGGVLDDFLALAEQSPDQVMDPATRRLQASALMLIGDYDAACRIAGDAVGASGSDFWQRAMVICAAFDGNRPQVYFRLELLAETGAVEPAFEAMALALLREIEGTASENSPEMPDLPARLDALDFTLARLSRTPAPASLAASAAPAVLSAALDLPDHGPEDRLTLIAAALEHGLVDATALAAALAAIPDDAPAEDADAATPVRSAEQEEADAADEAGSDTPVESAETVEAPEADPRLESLKGLGRAYRAALDAEAPRAVLDALDAAFAAGRASGHPVITARMLAGPLGRVSPDPALADRAHVAGRILILSGQSATARRWFDMAREADEAGNPAAEAAMLTLWPLLALAGETPGDTTPMADRWWRAQADEDTAGRKAATLAALLHALDDEPPAALQQAALAAGPMAATAPSAALWRQLLLAIHGGRSGETVLTALAGLRNGGTARTTESFQAAVIAGLRRAGLSDEARALALERLAHAGF